MALALALLCAGSWVGLSLLFNLLACLAGSSRAGRLNILARAGCCGYSILPSRLALPSGLLFNNPSRASPRPGAPAARIAYGWAVQALLDRLQTDQVMTSVFSLLSTFL